MSDQLPAEELDAARWRAIAPHLAVCLQARDGKMSLVLGPKWEEVEIPTGLLGGFTNVLIDAAVDALRARGNAGEVPAASATPSLSPLPSQENPQP